jgi:hypothetical protein
MITDMPVQKGQQTQTVASVVELEIQGIRGVTGAMLEQSSHRRDRYFHV